MAKQHLIYQACVGDVPLFYKSCVDSVARYCDRFGHDHIVQRDPVLRIAPLKSERSKNASRLGYLPIFEKENAFEYLADYESILVLDADIFIRKTAPNIFNEASADFCGVVEREMPLTGKYFEKIRKYSEGQYRRLSDVDWKWNQDGAEFFNMGVMLLGHGIHSYLNGQTPKEFIRRPEFEGFVNGVGHWRWSTDQTLLNWWVKSSGMTVSHLDWRWNALFGGVTDVSEAFFVHFFLSSKMPRGGSEIPDIVRGW